MPFSYSAMQLSPSTSPRPLTASIGATLQHIRKDSRSRKVVLAAFLLLSVAYGIVLLASGNVSNTCDPSNFGPELDTPYCRFSSWASSTLSSLSHGSGAVNPYQTLASSPGLVGNSSQGDIVTRNGTSIGRIVFGIGATAESWHQRGQLIKLWWKPNVTRGFLWLDRNLDSWTEGDLPFKISEDTSRFDYTHPSEVRSALRISRIVSETYRLGLPDVDWIVMGDDDTLFFTDNLVKVLSKYDHRKFHYIGANSEDTRQSARHHFGLAFGGGGFAISYPLAAALAGMQDECLERYTRLYGSDERVKACVSELGVPLTKELGFHQLDIRGDISGLLAAHPVAPIVSLHHLEDIDSLFYGMSHLEAAQRLMKAVDMDSVQMFQQSICYDEKKQWSFSVSWGYVVEVYEGFLTPRDLEMPAVTFWSWAGRREFEAFTMDTRPLEGVCERPTRFFMSSAENKTRGQRTVEMSVYDRLNEFENEKCNPKRKPMDMVKSVRVDSEPLPDEWAQNPRRQCCRVTNMSRQSISIQVGVCRDSESLTTSRVLSSMRKRRRLLR